MIGPVICTVHGKQLRIDLPPDFPTGGPVEVIILPLEKNAPAEVEQQWLESVWGCSIDFPERLPDLPTDGQQRMHHVERS